MENYKFKPKGFWGYAFMLLSVVSAFAAGIYIATATWGSLLPVLITVAVTTCMCAVGTVVAAFSRRKATTWIVTAAQAINVLVFVSLLVLSLLTMIICASNGNQSLEGIVNSARNAVCLAPLSEDNYGFGATFVIWLVVAAVALISLVHGILSFFALSALNGSYKGRLRTRGLSFFGIMSFVLVFVEAILFLAVCWPYAMNYLPESIASIRNENIVLSDTLNFGIYRISDWAGLAWIAAVILSMLVLAFYSFRLKKKLVRERLRAKVSQNPEDNKFAEEEDNHIENIMCIADKDDSEAVFEDSGDYSLQSVTGFANQDNCSQENAYKDVSMSSDDSIASHDDYGDFFEDNSDKDVLAPPEIIAVSEALSYSVLSQKADNPLQVEETDNQGGTLRKIDYIAQFDEEQEKRTENVVSGQDEVASADELLIIASDEINMVKSENGKFDSFFVELPKIPRTSMLDYGYSEDSII